MRPSSEVPLSEEMAFSASSVVAISTKPKPRERPVSRSVITAADITSPKRAKAPRRPSLEVENERPPTNSFTDMTCSFRLPGRLPRVYIRPGGGPRKPAGGRAGSRPAAGREEAEGGDEHGQKQREARATRGAEQDEAGGEEQRERESRRAHEVAPAPPTRSDIRDQGEGHRGPRAKVSSLPTGVAEC